jgi:hypothetical protein
LEEEMRPVRLALAVLAVAACSKDMPPKVDPFAPVPECKPGVLLVAPLSGDRQMVMSSLGIASYKEGFDLNLDGKIDNKLAPLGALANQTIMDAFTFQHNIVVPIELFGYTGTPDTDCTKFAFYLGRVVEDKDADGKDTEWQAGKCDCDDTNPMVHAGAMEMLGNRVDDDCDGYADNATMGTPPADTMDLDGDGVTLADGDCNDAMGDPLAPMRHRGAMDVCGNGIDEDCDGIPDNDPSCDPFKDNKVGVHITEQSFIGGDHSKPLIVFADGKVAKGVLSAGPDLFKLSVPFDKGINVDLVLTGARVRMVLDDKALGTYVDSGSDATVMQPNGILGGVLGASSLAQVTGINAGGVIKPPQSLLDAVFAGAAGPVLGLDQDADGHYLPDIDVDGDGLESFWQENKMVDADGGVPLAIVDTCKDGNGEIVHSNFDGMGTSCALAKDDKGNYRFPDGLSVALKFTAVPVKISDIVPK